MWCRFVGAQLGVLPGCKDTHLLSKNQRYFISSFEDKFELHLGILYLMLSA